MGCGEIETWSFVSLVGAFLDVVFTYLLLCASVSAFLASKFLGLFNLSLPCSCDGLFGEPRKKGCTAGTDKFDVGKGYDCWQNVLVDCPSKRLSAVRFLIMSRLPFDSVPILEVNEKPNFYFVNLGAKGNINCILIAGGGKLKLNSKREKSRISIRRRKRCSSSEQNVPTMFKEDLRNSVVNSLDKGSAVTDDGSNCEIKQMMEVSAGDQESNVSELEKALQEERTASATLRLELEKERNSSATAADEAMAMILRLQGEKAATEMEATQYQRISAEKSAYDLEEMNILKEILWRTEREKYFLQMELGECKEIISRVEQDLNEEEATSFLRNLPISDGYKVEEVASLGMHKVQQSNSPIYRATSLVESDAPNSSSEGKGFCHEPLVTNSFNKDYNMSSLNVVMDSFHEEIVSMNELKSKLLTQDETVVLDGGAVWSSDDSKALIRSEKFEQGVHDVHVIDYGATANSEISQNSNSQVSVNSNVPPNDVSGSKNTIRKSCSDVDSILPWKSVSSRNLLRLPDVRRNSMSAIDFEKVKLGNEVGLLRARLKIVQAGRKSLSFSAEHKGKHNRLCRTPGSRFSCPLDDPFDLPTPSTPQT